MMTPATAMLQAGCNVASTATGTLILLSIVVALSLTAMTKSIWTFVNMIQVIAYLRYFVEWSANASFGFECMDYAVTGRLQTNFIWAAYDLVVEGLNFNLEKETYENSWIEYLVDEPNLLRSLGVYPALFVLVILAMLYCSILSFCKNSNLSIRRQYLQLKRKLYWNSLFRFYLEIDLKLTHQAIAVAWFLGMNNILQFSMNAAISIILIVAPFCILWFLLSRQD